MIGIIGKLICTVKGEHEVLIGNEQEAREWIENITKVVDDNGFALLRCSRCGRVVTMVVDELEDES